MRLAVLGDPIEHSLSPVIHTAALRHAALAGTYEARRVDGRGMREAFAQIRDGALDGANVTMPHKQLAAELCDRLEPSAEKADAVNTLVRVGRDVIGHNTDVIGVGVAWSANDLPGDGPVLVLGNGGAAAAALLALADREVWVSGRAAGKAGDLAERLGVRATERPWGAGVADATVVNATPLGMAGEVLPAAVLDGARALLDMAYRRSEATPAVQTMTARRLPVADGEDVLIAQAAESFRLWTGVSVPLPVLADAIGQMRRSQPPSP